MMQEVEKEVHQVIKLQDFQEVKVKLSSKKKTKNTNFQPIIHL